MKEKVLPLNRRRNFLCIAVVASLAGITAVGIGQFASTRALGSTNALSTAIAIEFSTLDSHFATWGRSRIEARLSNGSAEKRIYVLEWIEGRGLSPLYDLICRSLTDPVISVRDVALRLLLSLDPRLLRPYIALVDVAVPIFKRPDIKTMVQRLVSRIELS